MSSDEDVRMEDVAEEPSFAFKGKGKATNGVNGDGDYTHDENLPWCVASSAHSDNTYALGRVEKYRPVTLDDVVSHKDITGTSEKLASL